MASNFNSRNSMNMYDTLEYPLFKVVLNDEKQGIDSISLVNRPAVKGEMIIHSDLRRITYPVMISETPLLQFNGEMYYYVIFDKEVLLELSKRLIDTRNINLVNYEHSEEFTDAKGVEIYVKDDKLMVSYELNEKDWNDVISGEFNGLSLEGKFKLEMIPTLYSDIIELINELNEFEREV